jgi:outer membrane protein assembly factor BamA
MVLSCISLLYGRAFAVELEEFSDNKKIYIKDIRIQGNNLLSEKEIFEISRFDRETGLYVDKISNGIQNLIKCGFFSEVSYSITAVPEGFVLDLNLKENPPLASLKIVESKFLDLTVLREKLKKNNVTTDMVFSPAMLEKSIEEFNIYYQNQGIFLYTVSTRLVTKEEIISEGGKFLYEPSELEKDGVHVVISIREIPRLVIGEIRMSKISISYDQILSYLRLSQGMKIQSDEELFFSYKRLKKLGFYDSVYFKLVQQDGIVYKLVIEGKELQLSDVSVTLTSPANIGLITSAEYYNIATFRTLQRFRAWAGWELLIGNPIFGIEYTNPFWYKALFSDVTLTKWDQVDIIKEGASQKLTENYEWKLTVGYNVWDNLFAYVYHDERYAITSAVDENFSRVDGQQKNSDLYHSSGVMAVWDSLDDNFFITQGYKLLGDIETYWRNPLAYKGQFSGELYVPVPMFNLIGVVDNRTNCLFTYRKDTKTTLSLDSRMRTNVQEIQTVDEQQIKLTTYSSAEMRFPIPDIGNIQDLCFVIFGEAGGAWSSYSNLSLSQSRYGFGIGLRMSPRKHYSSFLFQFPAGFYLGYRVGDSRVRPTLVSHRDQLYYINLTASF